MAVTTEKFDLTSTAWVAVAEGAENCSVVNQNKEVVCVTVGEDEPAIDSVDYIVVTKGLANSANFAQLGGTTVWARALNTTGASCVVFSGDA